MAQVKVQRHGEETACTIAGLRNACSLDSLWQSSGSGGAHVCTWVAQLSCLMLQVPVSFCAFKSGTCNKVTCSATASVQESIHGILPSQPGSQWGGNDDDSEHAAGDVQSRS